MIKFRPRPKIERPLGNENPNEMLTLAGSLLIGLVAFSALKIVEFWKKDRSSNNEPPKGSTRITSTGTRLILLK